MNRFIPFLFALVLGLILMGCQRDRVGYVIVDPTNVEVDDLLNAPEEYPLDGTTLVVQGSLVLDLMPKIGPPYDLPALQVHWEITSRDSQAVDSAQIKPRYLWVICQDKVLTIPIQTLTGNVQLRDVCECDSSAIIVVLLDYDNKSVLLRSPWLSVMCVQ